MKLFEDGEPTKEQYFYTQYWRIPFGKVFSEEDRLYIGKNMRLGTCKSPYPYHQRLHYPNRMCKDFLFDIGRDTIGGSTMYSEMLVKQTADMTDHELLETARRIHGEIYKRMAAKTAEILRSEDKDTAIKNLYNTIDELRTQLAAKIEKKMTKKEAVKLFEQFLESVR